MKNGINIEYKEGYDRALWDTIRFGLDYVYETERDITQFEIDNLPFSAGYSAAVKSGVASDLYYR